MVVVNDVQWGTLDNPIALTSIVGSEVFSVVLNQKNTNDASGMLSYFSYKSFGPNGEELESIDEYFGDTTLHSPVLSKNESGTISHYMLYSGDDEYTIEFTNYSDKYRFNIYISK